MTLTVSAMLPLRRRFPEIELSATRELRDEAREGTSIPTFSVGVSGIFYSAPLLG